MRNAATKLAVGAILLGVIQSQAKAEVLVTEAEAKLPSSVNVGVAMRGLTRGPGIEQLSPNPDKGVTSPLPLKIKFDIRNKVEIDLATIKLQYLKAKPVDLTDRIKKYVTGDGIDMGQAELPPGTHTLRLDLKDKQGRVATAIIKIVVTGK